MRRALVLASRHWRLALPLFLGTLVAGHIVAIVFGGARAASFAFVFLILAPLLGGAACLFRARYSKAGDGWLALSNGIFCWAAAMTLFAADYGGETAHGEMVVAQVLFVNWALPFLFIAASPSNETPAVRLVDGVLTLALGAQFFACVFIVMARPDQFDITLDLFDVENFYIAAFALARFLGSDRPEWRRFFGALAAFGFAHFAVTAINNRWGGGGDFSHLSGALVPIPFLLATWMALTPANTRHQAISPRDIVPRVINAGSPLMLPGTLLTMSGVMMPISLPLGIAGCSVAVLGYGVRTILVQLRDSAEQQRLATLSLTDPLTGLANRRSFDEALQREWGRARRKGEKLTVLMIDIDHFKQLNDTYGHAVGDERLRSVGHGLAACAKRGGDVVARFGGEEFAAILPSISAAEALALAEVMRATIVDLALPTPADERVVTVSIGVGHMKRVVGEDGTALIEAADHALYAAKGAGRNRIDLREIEGAAPTLQLVAGAKG